MATLEQLERALKGAIAAGDMDAARKLQAVVNEARQDMSNQIPGAGNVPGTTPEKPKPTFGQRLKGAGEAALTVGTGIPASIVGGLSGVASVPVNLAQRALGSQSPVDPEQVTKDVTGAFTYIPRSETGREFVQGIGEAAEPLQAVPGIQNELAALGMAAKGAAPALGAVKDLGAARTMQIAKSVQNAAAEARNSVKQSAVGQAFGARSIGAAETPQALQRRITAEQLGFKDDTALTAGQASREYGQVQFEKESAKLPELGKDLRQRNENQTKQLLQNFDDLVEQIGPINVDERSIGKAVDKALLNKANIADKRIQAAYQKARDAGELAQPVDTSPVVEVLNASSSAEGNAPVLVSARQQLIRLGGATRDEAGNLIAKEMSVNDLEELRKFINKSMAESGPDLKFGGDLKRGIDKATEAAGGDLYKEARKLRADYAREFENTALTGKLLNTKRGTSERQVAFEDVFQKTILDSPVEEMNKLRRTLLTGGDAGKQAWKDLKAKGLDYIKEKSFNAGMTEGGQPIVSPAKMARIIKEMDKDGKLESLYGKRQAQQLRDLSEIAQVIYTAPPGSVNTSNTASALAIALEGTATGAFTGLPVPVVSLLKQATAYVKDAKTRTRIRQALNAGQQK